MAELLSIEDLRAGYGEAVVLPGLSLRLPEGQVLALLGRNGTGKTTLINSIVGVTRRFSGAIRLAGRDVTVGAGILRARSQSSVVLIVTAGCICSKSTAGFIC